MASKEELKKLAGKENGIPKLLNELIKKNKQTKYENEVILLKQRFYRNEKSKNKGILELGIYNIELNLIINALLDLIDKVFEKEEYNPKREPQETDQNSDSTSFPKKGFLFYQVEKISNGYNIVVRIALNQEILAKNKEQNYEILEESISQTMRVKLDVTPVDRAKIKSDEEIQAIKNDNDDYTEWIFSVTPLHEIGNNELKIKFAEIIQIGNKEYPSWETIDVDEKLLIKADLIATKKQEEAAAKKAAASLAATTAATKVVKTKKKEKIAATTSNEGEGTWGWLPWLLLTPLFLAMLWFTRGCYGCDDESTKYPTPMDVTTIVTPPVRTNEVAAAAAKLAATTCACNSDCKVMNIPENGRARIVTKLGTNPEFGEAHDLTGPQFLGRLRNRYATEPPDTKFLDELFICMGYANGFADATADIFSEVTLPNGKTGNMGFGKNHGTTYATLNAKDAKDLEAFKIEAANGCDVHFMKTCGNYFFFCN